MIQVEIKMLPKGDESKARTLGLVEIGNKNVKSDIGRDYQVVLRKTPPFKGALKDIWKTGEVEEADVSLGTVSGFDPVDRGVYDLLYLALVSCGLPSRNPYPIILPEDRDIRQYDRAELVQAAGAYLLQPIMDETNVVGDSNVPHLFPFDKEEWKTFDSRVEELEEVKKLIDLEIFRLQHKPDQES